MKKTIQIMLIATPLMVTSVNAETANPTKEQQSRIENSKKIHELLQRNTLNPDNQIVNSLDPKLDLDDPEFQDY